MFRQNNFQVLGITTYVSAHSINTKIQQINSDDL